MPRDYSQEIITYQKRFRSWVQQCTKITRRYRLSTGLESNEVESAGSSQFNVLFSNVQTLMPALFGVEPIPAVRRRHGDMDPVGRIAAQVLERALRTELEDGALLMVGKQLALDVILCGRGVVWVSLDANVEKDTTTGEERVMDEYARLSYVHWADFAHSPHALNWQEIQQNGWVARRVLLTKEEGTERFGKDFGEAQPIGENDAEQNPTRRDNPDGEEDDRFEVWELWDAKTKDAVWLTGKKILERRKDPLKLEGFFPCVASYGATSNESLIPLPDYEQYRGLANVLDSLTSRIRSLTNQLQVKGVYDAQYPGIGDVLNATDEGQFIGVDQLNENMPLERAISYFPLEPLAVTLRELHAVREQTKQTLFEVSGISDIVRGQVDPREKLGQSQIKSQFAGQRLEDRRQSMSRSIKSLIHKKAEIIAELYTEEHLQSLSGYVLVPEIAALPPEQQQQVWPQVLHLLREEKLRSYRIDIELDSLGFQDEKQKRDETSEFMVGIGNFLEKALVIGQAAPDMIPALSDLLMVFVRQHKVGRSAEASIGEALEQVKERAQQQMQGAEQEQGPSEEEMEVQAAQAKLQMELQAAQAKTQAELQALQARTQLELAAKQQQTQSDLAAKQQSNIVDLEKKRAEAQIDLEKKGMLPA